MKKRLILIIACLCSLSAGAQFPKWLKKVRPAQVSVIATDTKGELHESQGIFINEAGDVVTEFDVMKNAAKASVIDAKGNEYKVTHICGVSNMYNMAKLAIEKGKAKISYIPQAANSARENEGIYILPHAKANKKAPCTMDTIMRVDTFMHEYLYYSLNKVPQERQSNCPVLNEKGELIGLVQMPMKKDEKSYAIDARYGADMEIATLDAGNTDLNNIRIAKRLPESENDALSYLFLTADKNDSIYLIHLDDFMARFPGNSSAYTLKAEYLVRKGDYAEAENVLNAGLGQEGTQKDELHYSFSKLIYGFCQEQNDSSQTAWTLESALEEADKAYVANPLPVYTDQKAICLYALKRYDEAAALFLSLTKTNMRSVDLFLLAVQCKEMANAKEEEVLTLLDSAVNFYQKPYPQAAAKPLMLRGRQLAKMQKYREAVKDYNEYEHLFAGNLPARFYYEREQIEVKCRMYPAAMNDIERAIRIAPKEPMLYAEYASLNYRIGQIEEAIKVAKDAIQIAPDYADPYRIIGVCYADQQKYEEAKEYLKKAISLGDKLSEGVLERISAQK